MLPKGLYDALPWLYMAMGATVTALLESDLKYLPAALFVTAGVLVLLYRSASRKVAARAAARLRPEQRRAH
ncbi:MAG TPA: hypothetical protein VNJ47_06710 [Nevskiales bacterium]|nr:hypothetical protein [Nevskiales bacterium]